MDRPLKVNDSLQPIDWLGIFVVVLAILFFVWQIFYRYFADYHYLPDRLQEGWFNVLTIDMSPDSVMSQDSILEGEDLVIVAPSQNANNAVSFVPLQNFSAGVLSQLPDSRLDPSSPLFSQLDILYFQNRVMHLVPLYRAGIRAIALDRDALIARMGKKINNPMEIVGYAILSNGAKRYIHAVPINGFYLRGTVVLDQVPGITNNNTAPAQQSIFYSMPQ